MSAVPPIERLLLTTDTVGGVWTYALELARGLEKTGTHVFLASMGAAPTSDQGQAVRKLSHVTWEHRPGALEWMEDPWRNVDDAGDWLLDLETRFRPDLIHLNEFSHAARSWKAPVLVVAHSCILTWWRAVKREPAPQAYAEYERRVTRGLRAAHGVVAPTQAMIEALEEEYGFLDRTEVIPNGRTFPPGPIASKQPIIFSAGRLWDQAKNIALLEKIAEGLQWPIHVAGQTREPGKAEVVFPHLQCLGSLASDELASMLAHSSIYAAPALYEPFGLAILEAASHGCALVLADIPSLREIWKDAAIFVSPHEPAAWQTVLNALSVDHKKREQFANLAKKRAGDFSTQRMAARYQALYAQLLAEAGSSIPAATRSAA